MNSNRNIGFMVYVYIMIIIVIVLSLIIFILLFRYKTYYRVNGIIVYENDKYLMRVYVPSNYTDYFVNTNSFEINGKSYKYNIVSSNNEYLVGDMGNYVMFDIEFVIPDNYKYVNLILEIKLFKEDKRIIDYFIGGIDERT